MLIGELSALGGALIWALSGVLLTRINRKVHVAAIGLVRCVSASLFFILLLPFSGGWGVFGGVDWAVILSLLAAVLISLGLGDSLFLVSAKRIGMVRAMPLTMSFPLFAVVLAAIFLGERVGVAALGGALLILGGTYLLSSRPRLTEAVSVPPLDVAGLLLALLTAVLWATSAVIMTPISQEIHPVAVNMIRYFAGATLFAAVVPRAGGLGQLRTLNRQERTMLVAGGLLGSGIGSFLYLSALRYAGAAISSVLTAASPLFSTPLSILMLGEKVDRRIVAGTLTIIVGVGMVIVGS